MASKKRRVSRKKRSFITTTYHEPKLYKDLRAAWKGFKRQAITVLAATGFITVIVLFFQMIMK